VALPPEPEPTSRARRGDLIVLGLVVAALGGLGAWWFGRDVETAAAPSPSASTTTSAPKLCATTLPSATLPVEPAPPFEPPSSNLVVEARVSVAALTQAVDATLPKTLDSAQRKPIGTPGEITYQVTRGQPALSLKNGALVVDLPISASVEICKPLGPLCPTYGRCQPTLSSRTTLPLEPTEDWKLEGAAVAVSVQTGCSVAGLDATAEVKKAAEKGRQRAQGQIAAALKKVEKDLDEQLSRLARPLRLAAGQCVKVAPETVRYQPVVEAEGQLRLVAAVEGRLSSSPCDAPAQKNHTVPPLSRGTLGEPALRLTTIILYAELLTALNESLPDGVAEVHALRAHGPKLAVEVTLEGRRCGRMWAVVEPQWKDGRLQLSGSGSVPALSAPWSFEPLPGLEQLDAVEGVTARQDLKEVPPQWIVTQGGLAVVRVRTGRVELVLDPAALSPAKPK